MLFLYILLGFAMLILLVLLLPVRVRLTMDESGKLSVKVALSVFSVFSQPAPQKAPHLSHYSRRAMRRLEKKQMRKAERAARKRAARRKSATTTRTAKKQPLTLQQKVQLLQDLLAMIASLVEKLHGKLFRAAHLHVRALRVRIGTDDAAKTALLHGALCPAVRFLLQAVDECSNLHLHHPERMYIAPDFTRSVFEAQLDLCLRMRVVHVLSLGLGALFHILGHKSRRTPTHASPPAKSFGSI